MAKQDTPRDQAQQKDFPPRQDEQVRGIANPEVDDDVDEEFDDSDEVDEEDDNDEGAI